MEKKPKRTVSLRIGIIIFLAVFILGSNIVSIPAYFVELNMIEFIAESGPQRFAPEDTIRIDDVITIKSAIRTIRDLKRMDSDTARSKICIYLCSPGGQAIAAEAICRAMKECQKPIEIRCDIAASAAVAILVSGTKGMRFIDEYAYIMIHRGRYAGEDFIWLKPLLWLLRNTSGKLGSRRVERWYARTISENTGQPLNRIIEDMKNEREIYVSEAIEYGIADSVLLHNFKKEAGQ